MLMGLVPQSAIYVPWTVLGIIWLAAALWTNQAVTRFAFVQGLAYRVVVLAGFVLLLGVVARHRGNVVEIGSFPGLLGRTLWVLPLTAAWMAVDATALSICFILWARAYLGRLWSGRITRREGHYIVDTGPYAIVRHPIYSGLIGASLTTAIVLGNVQAVIGALLLTAGYWIKTQLEEKFLRSELGAAYDAYRRKVPMLIPFSPPR